MKLTYSYGFCVPEDSLRVNLVKIAKYILIIRKIILVLKEFTVHILSRKAAYDLFYRTGLCHCKGSSVVTWHNIKIKDNHNSYIDMWLFMFYSTIEHYSSAAEGFNGMTLLRAIGDFLSLILS